MLLSLFEKFIDELKKDENKKQIEKLLDDYFKLPYIFKNISMYLYAIFLLLSIIFIFQMIMLKKLYNVEIFKI